MSQPPPFDPYRPPQTATDLTPADAGPKFRREGKILLVRDGAELPPYCVKTMQPLENGAGRRRRNLAWTPQWIPLVLLLSLVLVGWLGPLLVLVITALAIVALVSRKKLRLGYSLSRKGANRCHALRALAVAGVLAGIGLMALTQRPGFSENGTIFCALGGGLMTVICLLTLTQISALKVTGWKAGWFRIKGCHPGFLDRIGS